MKKLTAMMLAIAMIFSLTACGAGAEVPNAGVHTSAPTEAVTFHDSGYWVAVRVESEDPGACVSEEDMPYVNMARYLELTADGTGTLFLDKIFSITWHDGTIALPEDGTTLSYTRNGEELKLDRADLTLVFRKGKKPEVRDPDQVMQQFTGFMEVGIPYPYITGTYEGKTVATTAEAIVTSYEVFDSADGFPAREGYEWRVVKMQIRYYDEYSEKYGCDIDAIFDDYYNTKLLNDAAVLMEETDTYVLHGYPVLQNGEQKDAFCYWTGYQWGEWYANEEHHVEIIVETQWNFLVPTGYDGCIAGLMDSRIQWTDGTYITDYSPENYLLFRAC